MNVAAVAFQIVLTKADDIGPVKLAARIKEAEQLARDAAEILAQSEVRKRLTAQGMTQATMSPKAFDKAIQDETAVWAGVIKSRHIQAQ